MKTQEKSLPIKKILLSGTLICLILTGIALILVGPIKQWIRDYYTQSAVDLAEERIIGGLGPIEYKVPTTDALSVEGENGEQDVALKDLAQDMQDLSDQYTTLTLVGLLEIPCIDVKEPVFDDVSTVSLRYGLGVFPGTGPIGSSGLTSIWGHRMKSNTKFSKLQYLEDDIGELVILTTMDGIQHYYKIVDTVYAADGALMTYMNSESYSSETLALLTCGYGENPLKEGEWHKWNTEFVVICEPWEGSLPGED